MSSAVTYRVDGAVAVATLNRPESLNAISSELLAALDQAVAAAMSDGAVRALVITGTGRAFCAGANLTEVQALQKGWQLHDWVQRVQRTFLAIEAAPKPVLAAINGLAYGGGCELALACDLRIAAPEARLGVPEIKVGLLPAAGGMSRLPALIGRGRALQMILTGRDVGAAEALSWGLVNEVAGDGELLSRAMAWATELAALPPLALQVGKEAVLTNRDLGAQEAGRVEAQAVGMLFDSADTQEGLSAFVAKRKPRFQGR